MEEKNLPKFDWDEPQGTNSGHTKEEWGQKENNKKPVKIRMIPAYTIVWTKSE